MGKRRIRKIALIFLSLLMVEKLAASEVMPREEEINPPLSRSFSSPLLTDIPKIQSFPLLNEQIFGLVELKKGLDDIARLQNKNTTYELEALERRYGRNSRTYRFAERQNQNPTQIPYHRHASLLEAGEVDRSREDPLAWLKAVILDLKVLIHRVENLKSVFEVEYKIKQQLRKAYKESKGLNQSKSMLNPFGYWEWWQNYYFSPSEINKYIDCYTFCFWRELRDKEKRYSRDYHKKLADFKVGTLRVLDPNRRSLRLRAEIRV